MPYFAASCRDWTTRSAEAGSARAWVRRSRPRERGTRTGAAWTAAGTRVSARSRERIVEGVPACRLRAEPSSEGWPTAQPGFFRAPGCCRTCATGQIRLTCVSVPPTRRPPLPDETTPRSRPPGRPLRRPGRPCRGRHVDVRQLPQRRRPEEIRLLGGQGLARPRAAVERPARARLLGKLRLSGRPGDDQSPLRAPVHPGSVDAAAGPERQRLLREDPGRGADLPA